MEHITKCIQYLDIIFLKLSRNRNEPDFAESHYYRINQILLSIVQLWPYKKSISTNIIRIFVLGILLSDILVQLTTFLTYEYNADFFILVFSYILPYSICVIQYCFFCVNPNKIKQLWQHIYDIWNNLKDEAECNIMRGYSYIGKLNTIYLTVGGMTAFGLYTSFLLLPPALDVILPLNEPRPRKIYALTEYFVDSEKYFYPILCHLMFGLFLSLLISLAEWTFVVAYIYHICGLLKIVCHRIEKSIESCTVLKLKKCDKESLYRISTTVDIHRIALKYVDYVTSTFVSVVVVMVASIIAALILNWFRLITAIVSGNTNDILITVALPVYYVILLFFGNYYGQQIIDHSSEIFNNAYEVRWYAAPTEMQKILLFLLTRTKETCSLNMSNIVTASMESFAMFLKMSVSYAMALYSLMN